MEAVEVRKGSSTIKFGPRTTSGAINLISSSVPETQEIEALTAYGTDSTQRLQGHYGNSFIAENGLHYGFVIDASHDSSDGFKTIDIVGGDTGYSIQDIMGKFKISNDPSSKVYQSLEVKLGATEEDSNETYLGLTQEDFDSNPYRRYAASQLDKLDTSHRQHQLRHFIDFGQLDVTTTLYHNQFSRNWNRLRDVTIGGVTNGLSGSLENTTFLAALQGLTDLDGSAANNLDLRANARDYYSTGIQTDIAAAFDYGKTDHQLEIGLRYHYDKEDRFQQEDRYSITNGVLNLVTPGSPGSQSNRHSTARATALYILDEIKYDNWTFVPGLRYEHINTRREDFNSSQIRNNAIDALVPGLGISYGFENDLTIFGGIHKGFAPPSPSSTQDDEEESVNYELGARYNSPIFNAEIAGFFNDYSNLLGECTLSSGCTTGTVGDQFNAGEIDAYGFELSLGYDIAPSLDYTAISLPINFNYTYTKAEFQNSFVSAFDEWGTVTSGDELPYIPEHQFYLSAGVIADKWEMHVAGKYVDEMRTTAGSGNISADEGTDAHFVVDVAGEYEFMPQTRLFFTGDNIFDKEYVAGRRPAGARPGKPMTWLAGVKFEF